jgi:hypothetical protein
MIFNVNDTEEEPNPLNQFGLAEKDLQVENTKEEENPVIPIIPLHTIPIHISNQKTSEDADLELEIKAVPEQEKEDFPVKVVPGSLQS